MKKLLLVLALPLMLVGCTDTKADTTPDRTWIELGGNQTLKVYWGSNVATYSLESYKKVEFRVDYEVHSKNFVTLVQVKATYSTDVFHYEYKGVTVTFVLTTKNG